MQRFFALMALAFCGNILVAQSFFTPTTYSGAFGSTDWTLNWTSWNPRNTSYPAGTTTLQGIISSNTTLTSNKTYFLKGYVYVRNNATLTIEPGTIIRCDVLSSATLIITRGSKLICNGTENAPIVFTSSEAAGSRTYGDWGGVVILGQAKINASGGVADVGAGINNANGDGLFGGNNDEDSSGSMSYTRIEFAGIQYQPDKEINGLNLAAVGSKTYFDHIELSYCGNDGIHLAGGTARLKHLVLHRGFDTDISMDLGYRGLIQFAVVLRDSTKANASGVSGIEIQNDGLATSANPQTDPTLSNLTILGPLTYLTSSYNSNYRYGVHVRRNGKGAIFNSAFAGYPKGLVFDGPGCATQVSNGQFIFEHNTMAGHKTHVLDTTGKFAQAFPLFSPANWIADGSRNISVKTNPRDLKLKAPYIFNSPEFIPLAGSPLLAAADFNHSRLSQTESIENVALSLGAVYSYQQEMAIETRGESGAFKVLVYDLNGKFMAQHYLQLSANEKQIIPMPYCGIYCIRIVRESDGRAITKRLFFQ